MATLTISNLAPGRTAVLQLYTRGTETTAGSAGTNLGGWGAVGTARDANESSSVDGS